MAAVMVEVAAAAAMAHSSGSRALHGGAVAAGGPSPLRLLSHGSASSSRAVLPTSRGLKLSFGASSSARRLSAATSRASQQKRIVCEASETAVGATGIVSDQSFQSQVLESDVLVLVDFWAPWCGPCRMIAPIVDELAKQYAGKLKCLKLNTDESPYIATEYGIRSIPTVMFFKSGEKKDTVIGAVPKSTLAATIEKHLEW